MQTGQDLNPLLDNQKTQLELTFSEGDSIDGKALAILGANIAIITYINQTATGLAAWEYIAMYVPFGISLVLDVISIWPRRYKGPGVQDIAPYLNLSDEERMLKLLSNTQAAILHNTGLNRRRMRSALYSIGLTGLGFLLLLGIL